jgi:hypothetical protein
MTKEALELTRITVRPFLALQPGDVNLSLNQREQKATLVFHLKNTGPVPANLVTAELTFFDDAEVIEDDNESKHYRKDRQHPQDVVIFPGGVYNVGTDVYFDKGLLDNITNGKVKLRFRATYNAQSREYVTIQTEKLEKAEGGMIRRLPIQPQKWT